MKMDFKKLIMKVAGTTALCGMFAFGAVFNCEKADAAKVPMDEMGASVTFCGHGINEFRYSGNYMTLSQLPVLKSDGSFTVENLSTTGDMNVDNSYLKVYLYDEEDYEVLYSENGGKKFNVISPCYDDTRSHFIKVSASAINSGKKTVIRVTDGEDYADFEIDYSKMKKNAAKTISPKLKYETGDSDFPYGKIAVESQDVLPGEGWYFSASYDDCEYKSLNKEDYKAPKDYEDYAKEFNNFMSNVVRYGNTVSLSNSSFYKNTKQVDYKYEYTTGDNGYKIIISTATKEECSEAVNKDLGSIELYYYAVKNNGDKALMNKYLNVTDKKYEDGKLIAVTGYCELFDSNHANSYYFKITKTYGDGSVNFASESSTVVYKMPKLKIKAQPAAPNITFNAVKGTLNTKDTMEYSYKLSASSNADDLKWHDWKTATKNMTIADIKDANGNPINVASGASIRIRVKADTKKIVSKSRLIKIPAIKGIDTSKISISGSLDAATLKADDYDKDKNPYEYTTSEPTKDTKWTALKGSVTFKGKKAITKDTVIYVRKAGTNFNAKKGVDTRRASCCAVYKYDEASATWILSGVIVA